jgi:hypothetical protein
MGWLVCAALLAAAWLAASCGGGVDTGGTGGTATTYSTGSISGFGSIIVNGVRFDDTNASVLDDDGALHMQHADLKLGMVVDVVAGEITTDSSGAAVGAATQIVFSAEIAGPVQALNAAAGTLTVLGQPVKVDANTVFGGVSNGLAGLNVGDTVEVFGFYDTQSGSYLAARIDKDSSLSAYKLRGPIAPGSIDAANKKFSIGGAAISYAGVNGAQLPALQDNLLVRVKLQTAPASGVWVATQVSAAARHVPDQAHTEAEGFVTDFASLGSFKVNGLQVDASGSTVAFHNGSASAVANGARVEIGGRMSNGVLVAAQVSFNTSGRGNAGHGDQAFQLHGAVSAPVPASSTFVLRGITVHYDGNTVFDSGTAAGLLAGTLVDVDATLISGSGDLLATKIKFAH